MQRKRVVHVVENLERGGLERIVVDLARHQHRSGYQCEVVCVFGQGRLAQELLPLGIPVTACGKRGTFDLRALWRLRRKLADAAGAILHTHNAAAHYHALFAGRGIRFASVVNTRHGMGASDPSSRREQRYRASMASTDYVVAVCEAARRQYAAMDLRPRRGLVTVTNGIEVARHAPAGSAGRSRLRAQLDVPADTLLIGTVGRLNWAKDQQTLIRAFARLRSTLAYRPVALLLVGDGECRGALEEEARLQGVEDSVFFLGDRNDVATLLQGLDLFTLSSVTEGYSVALLEASATALPIVATEVGGNAEIVSHTETGLLVPARDVEALCASFAAILEDEDRAAAMGRAGRNWCLRHGSLERMADDYVNLYSTDIG